jgi:hypothetical protein
VTRNISHQHAHTMPIDLDELIEIPSNGGHRTVRSGNTEVLKLGQKITGVWTRVWRPYIPLQIAHHTRMRTPLRQRIAAMVQAVAPMDKRSFPGRYPSPGRGAFPELHLPCSCYASEDSASRHGDLGDLPAPAHSQVEILTCHSGMLRAVPWSASARLVMRRNPVD